MWSSLINPAYLPRIFFLFDVTFFLIKAFLESTGFPSRAILNVSLYCMRNTSVGYIDFLHLSLIHISLSSSHFFLFPIAMLSIFFTCFFFPYGVRE